jgi:hypothetical protein
LEYLKLERSLAVDPNLADTLNMFEGTVGVGRGVDGNAVRV